MCFICLAICVAFATGVLCNIEEQKIYPEVYSGNFHGDILLGEYGLRNGIVDETMRWPNQTVIIEISENFTSEEVRTIWTGLREIEEYTCITFQYKTEDDEAYIAIGKKYWGCFSEIGFNNRKQIMNIGGTCVDYPEIVMHEMMHGLGFHHEHSRSDRDEYVDIILANVIKGQEHNFVRFNETVTDFGVEYDYKSVMHYQGNYFSSNGELTIVTKDPKAQDIIGKSKHLSSGDIQKINRMYKCEN